MFSRKSPCESRTRGKRGTAGGNAGGLLKESPRPPRTFLEQICCWDGVCAGSKGDNTLSNRHRIKGSGERRGTLERVPQTPQNFSRINLLLGRRLCPIPWEIPLEQSPPRDKPVPPGFKPRGCKGRSPLHKITINLPLPRWGKGVGGERGQENQLKLKAVATGDKESTPTSRTPPAEQWQNKPTPQTNLRKTKKGTHAPSIQTSQLSNYQAIIAKIHLQPKRRKRRGEKETQTNEEPQHRRGARGSSPRSISIG